MKGGGRRKELEGAGEERKEGKGGEEERGGRGRRVGGKGGEVRPIYRGQETQTGNGGALFHVCCETLEAPRTTGTGKSCSLPCQGQAGPHRAGAQRAVRKEAPRRAGSPGTEVLQGGSLWVGEGGWVWTPAQ